MRFFLRYRWRIAVFVLLSIGIIYYARWRFAALEQPQLVLTYSGLWQGEGKHCLSVDATSSTEALA
jgi:hypothetical protein